MRVAISVVMSFTFSRRGALLICSDGDGDLVDIKIIVAVVPFDQYGWDAVDCISAIFEVSFEL